MFTPGPTAVGHLPSVFLEKYSLDQGIQVTSHLRVFNDDKHFCPPLISLSPVIHSLFSKHSPLSSWSPVWSIQLWFPSHCSGQPSPEGNTGPPVFLLLYAITLGHLIHTHSSKPRLEANASQMYIVTMTTELLHKYVPGNVPGAVLRLLTTLIRHH